ncbi:hypothetical protein WH7805_11983 [Synechococcus sp. WH 7805]|nr:hypothetical protein WH7805_11983 [Synechococcus sp. WH 7805]
MQKPRNTVESKAINEIYTKTEIILNEEQADYKRL